MSPLMATATQSSTEASDAFDMSPSLSDFQKSIGLASNELASPVESLPAFPPVDKHDLPYGQNHAQAAFFVELQPLSDSDASSIHKMDDRFQDVDRDDTENAPVEVSMADAT